MFLSVVRLVVYDKLSIKASIKHFSTHLTYFLFQDEDSDLFFEVECHTLIGVTNVFLECLLHDVSHEYAAPIISQQGEVSRLVLLTVSLE